MITNVRGTNLGRLEKHHQTVEFATAARLRGTGVLALWSPTLSRLAVVTGGGQTTGVGANHPSTLLTDLRGAEGDTVDLQLRTTDRTHLRTRATVLGCHFTTNASTTTTSS